MLGKHSGRAALQGSGSSRSATSSTTRSSRGPSIASSALCDKKKTIYDEDLYPLVAEDFSLKEVYKLVDVEFRGGSEVQPWARVFLEVDGVERSAETSGDGPVEALIEAIKLIADKPELKLRDYELSAPSSGADAPG